MTVWPSLFLVETGAGRAGAASGGLAGTLLMKVRPTRHVRDRQTDGVKQMKSKRWM